MEKRKHSVLLIVIILLLCLATGGICVGGVSSYLLFQTMSTAVEGSRTPTEEEDEARIEWLLAHPDKIESEELDKIEARTHERSRQDVVEACAPGGDPMMCENAKRINQIIVDGGIPSVPMPPSDPRGGFEQIDLSTEPPAPTAVIDSMPAAP
ncbi:MAG: hypothetical protein WC730_00095 [Patescibacteria group bacterium]|jgi:hypothetical protein